MRKPRMMALAIALLMSGPVLAKQSIDSCFPRRLMAS